jgi:nucleoside-diphosphate-sugar epimerase
MPSNVIAVTGASGFVGHHVCDDLLRRGYSVRAVSRRPLVAQAGKQVISVRSFSDAEQLGAALRGASTVIHLAARAHHVRERGDREADYTDANISGTRAVAEAAAREGVRHVIFASSVKAVAEFSSTPLRDDTPPNPMDPYGRSKLAAENVLIQTGRNRGFQTTVLRFPLVYGAGIKGNMRRLFDAVWAGIPIPLASSENARTMLGIENLTTFVARICQVPPPSDRPFLLSDKETVSTSALIQLIGGALGRRPRVFKLPHSLLRGIARFGDAISSVGIPFLTSAELNRLTGSLIVDSSRAWAAVNLEPARSLGAGISDTAAWYVCLRAGSLSSAEGEQWM